jgi:competence protein ComEA
VLSHRFFLRRSEPDPDDIEAAQARLEKVVLAARSGWTPSSIDDDGGSVAVEDGPAAASGRITGAHARSRTDRRVFDGRALAALAVLAVLSMLIAVWYVWRSWPVAADVPARSEIVSTPPPGSSAPTDGAAAAPTFPASGAAAASPTPTTGLVVHVAGSVAQPGIVTLPAGARVADAIQAAGGTLPGTDTTGVNLARVLVDGEQVLVGLPAAMGAPAPGPGTGPIQGTGEGPLDLNAATLDQLQNLPGVGPVLAQRIVDWRTAHGRFTSVDELQEVSGIGEQRLEDLRSLVRV